MIKSMKLHNKVNYTVSSANLNLLIDKISSN